MNCSDSLFRTDLLKYGIEVKTLQEILDIDKESAQGFLSGNIMFSIEELVKIADYHGLSLDMLARMEKSYLEQQSA